MANTLMFEVGIKSAQEQLDKIKQEFTKANGELSKLLKLQVSIEGVDTITRALSQIGDSSALRNLRNEVAALNREFSILSKGAGGTGDIASRGIAADIENTTQNIERYTNKIKQLTEERGHLVGGTRNSNYQNMTDEILRYTTQLEGARSKLARLTEEKNKLADSKTFDKPIEGALNLETAVTRVETAINGLKSGMNVNLSGDFSKWAQEVQAVTVSVKELVEQLQKITTADGIKTFTVSASASLSKLREEAEKIQNTFGKFADRSDAFKHIQNSLSGGVWFNLSGKQINEVEYAKSLIRTLNDEKVLQKELNELRAKNPLASLTDTKLANFGQIERTYIEMIDLLRRVNQEKEKLASSNTAPTAQGGVFDPQRFTTLQEAIDKIISEINRLQQAFTHLGENGSLSNLSTMINGLAVTLSSLGNAIKIQPLDDQVKTLLERCERAEAKLREVGDAARYLNEQAGAKTQQKASNIMGIAGIEEEQLNKVSSTAERFQRLLVEIENQMARIGKIQALGELSGFSPTILKNAHDQLEALHKMVESTYKGKPLADGLIIPASDSQLSQFNQQFGLLKAQYRDIVKEADNYNKQQEKNASVQEKFANAIRKTYSDLGLRQNDPGLQNISSAMDAILPKLAKVREDIDMLKTAINSGSKEGVPFINENIQLLQTQAEALMRQYVALAEARNRLTAGGNERSLFSTVQQNKELELLNEAYRKGTSELQKKAKAEDEASKASERSANEQKKAQEKIQNAAKRTAENLGTLTDKLDAKKINFKGMDFTELDTAISKIRAIKTELENLATTGRSSHGNTANEILKNMGLAGANEEARIALNHLTTGKREAEKANKDLSDSEQRLANAIKGTSDSMRGQSQVLSDLKMMATQYLSIWGAQSFVNNIIETGGLLEQQRLSLSAILGDMGKAQTLFNQIKTMALKSPFGVVELDKMSKQLAAYSFEYEELFDWTKRLADISAATGTSVDRLALALGHVRSEGALSGYTLRQFAMANVPVLRMLSENLGISSKEVRERVKKKEISAEDVQDILKQLTEDGGMFANAQETMSEALNAKFKNLRDAFDIMYGEIAESGIGDKLKDLAAILTDGAKHWERLATDVKDVAIAFGIGKVAMLMYNNALGKGTAITLKSALASKQKEIANLQLTASYRQLTTAELRTMANAGKLNATNIATLLSTKKLTYAELERAVALGKVDKATAMVALRTQGMYKQMNLLRQVAPLQGFARMWAIVAYNIKLAGVAVKSFLASAWPLLALTAVFELWNRRSEQKDDARDMAKTMAGNARGREAYEMRDSLADSRKLSDEALKQNIEEMQNALIAANAYTDGLKKQVSATDDLTKKYDLLKLKINEVADAYEEQKVTQESMMNEAWDAGGGLFSDNMLEDTKQFDTAMAEYQKKLTIASKQIKSVLSEWLKNQGQFKEEFSTMTGKQIFETLTNEMQASFLNYAWNAKGLDDVTSEMLREISRAYSKVGDKLSEMRGEQGEEFASTMKAMYEEAFKVDLDKASDEQKIAFDKWLRETLARAEDLSNDAKEALRNIVIDFTIKLVPHYVVDKPQTAQDVIDQQIGDNKWLSGFFGRQNNKNTTGVWTVETAQKEVKKYKKLFGDISLSNLDTAPKKLNSLLDGLEETKLNLQNTLSNGLLSQEEKDAIQRSLNETTESIDLANKALSDVGGKRKKKGGSKGGGGKNLDTERAKAVREQVRVIKEAADAYQYWRDKVGDKAAWEHVESEFGDILHKIGITADNIDDVRGRLKTIPLMKEYREIKDQKVKTEIDKEIAKEEDQYKRKDFERDTEKFLSETQIKLDALTRAWEKFNTVRDATGNVQLAINIAGVKYQEGQRTLADAVRQSVEDDFKSFGVQAIPFSVELDKESIKRQIQETFAAVAPIKPVQGKDESAEDFKQRMDAYNAALATHEARIKGVVTEYEKWQELEKQVQQNDLQVYSNLVGSTVDLVTQLQKVNDEYRKEIESLERLKKLGVENGGISNAEFDRASRISTSNYEMKRVQAQKEYQFLMDGVITMNKEAAKTIRNEYVEALKGKLRAGTITAKEYADKIEEINDKMRELEHQQSDGMAYWGGGTDGLINNMKKRAKAQEEAGAAEIQQGQKLMDLANSLGNAEMFMKGFSQMQSGQKMAAAGQGLSEFAGGMSETMAYVDIIVHGINDIVQGFKALIDEIDEMDQALGNGSLKESGDDVYTFIDSFSRASNKATQAFDSFKNGDMMGMMAGIVGSFTQWVTGFAQGHDRKRDHEIKVAEEQLKIVKSIDSRLETQLSRTLGGGTTATIDRATLMRYAPMSDLWNQMQAGDTKAWIQYLHSYSGMQMQGLSGSTLDAIRTAAQNESVYSAQLASLMEQRDLISQQLAAESDKKNSDNTAINEYEQQIAELNDKIKYFVEDAGKELYGLDLKGWASQIGDALMTAFENGEDAMEAFRDTAKDIMRDVASEMLKLGVLEPMMENLRQELFGKEWTDSNGNVWRGVYNQTTGRFDETQTLSILDKYFGEGGEMEKAVGAGQEFYDWVQKITGEDLRSSDSSSSMSNTIKGVTEQTADLLCSYVSAIRLDVSVNRAAIAQYFPMFYQALTSQNGSLANIENHTAAIMRSNDAIERSNQAILDSINGLKNKAWKVPIA